MRRLVRLLFPALASLAAVSAPVSAPAEEVGSVDTAFKLLGANHKIVIEAFDDPDLPGVSCFLSRAKTGGISGSLGLAEDTSDASIACRQTGPIKIPAELEEGEQVFRQRTSLLFKKLQVVRFHDEARNGERCSAAGSGALQLRRRRTLRLHTLPAPPLDSPPPGTARHCQTPLARQRRAWQRQSGGGVPNGGGE